MKIITVNKIKCNHCVDEIEATVLQPFIRYRRDKVAVDHGLELLKQNSANV